MTSSPIAAHNLNAKLFGGTDEVTEKSDDSIRPTNHCRFKNHIIIDVRQRGAPELGQSHRFGHCCHRIKQCFNVPNRKARRFRKCDLDQAANCLPASIVCEDQSDIRFLKRAPGPPPFSSSNSTPAASNARRMAIALANVIAVFPLTVSAR